MEAEYIEKFYRMYSRDVYLYTFSLCKDRQLAEDIMQEAFMKAIFTVDKVENNMKFWLFRVCRNLFIDYTRKNNRLSNIPIEEYDFKSDDLETINELIKKEESLKLYKSILKLPQEMKELIILYYYLEIPQAKIAELMNISNGSVRIMLFRARNKLKIMMEESYEF